MYKERFQNFANRFLLLLFRVTTTSCSAPTGASAAATWPPFAATGKFGSLNQKPATRTRSSKEERSCPRKEPGSPGSWITNIFSSLVSPSKTSV